MISTTNASWTVDVVVEVPAVTALACEGFLDPPLQGYFSFVGE